MSGVPADAAAAPWDPAAADYTGRKGTTIYVSKLGDDSDGASWEKAFHTIQKALLAVPDEKGGHRVVVRPDTYSEANLYPAAKGAEGAALVRRFFGSPTADRNLHITRRLSLCRVYPYGGDAAGQRGDQSHPLFPESRMPI